MHKVWSFLAVFVVGCAAGGGAVYVLTPVPVAAAAKNPLLSATRQEMLRLVPGYFQPCGPILYENAPEQAKKDFCIDQVRQAVLMYHQQHLTDAEILDPRVKKQWLAVMKGK